MSLKVIGAGFGRTGTLSLKLALEQLGFGPCYHMVEVFKHRDHLPRWIAAHEGADTDWADLFSGYAATVDWPSCNLWQAQLAAFPEAKILLSRRDPKAWYRSVMSTIYPSSVASRNSDDPGQAAFGAFAHKVIWDRVFGGDMEDEARVCEIFEAHNAAVMDAAPKDRLLVFEASDGWGPLCEFLEVPVPDTPYPRSNSTEEFQKHQGPRS
jgi:hypothetical protein